VLELQTLAVARDGQRMSVRVLGVDALAVGAVAPQLVPVPATGADRLDVARARHRVPQSRGAKAVARGARAAADRHGAAILARLPAAAAPGAGPLLVMDIAAARTCSAAAASSRASTCA
jgi:putative ABC transport system permease protein